MQRLILLILGLTLLPVAALSAQTCSPGDTLRITRQGAALWYILVDGDTLRHRADGPPRGFTSEGVAAAHAVALRALTRRTVELHQTYRGRVLGCIPSVPASPSPGDTLVPPPAPDSLPAETPEQPPQDTVALGPVRPRALGTITCRPEAICTGDARASVGDSLQWIDEGSGVVLGDFRGFLWGPRTLGFTPGAPRTRTWWIVAHSGPLADTARVVWTVPVTEETVYPALPLGTVIGAGLPLQRWITEHPVDGGPVVHWMSEGGSALVSRCGGLWLSAAWAPAESLRVGRVDRPALEEGMRTCRGVIP